MAEDVVVLTAGATPEQVFDAARTALEAKGYLWVRTSPTSAEAHEGGKPITRKRSRKLLLGLEVAPGRLTMESRSNGAVGFAAGMGALPAMSLRREFRRASVAVRSALGGAGLTGS
ncbi:MAG: hypothetical protein QM658_13985 [Gordonia sp. (in: high G+C Gram-positive bacteria)]